MTLQPNIPNVLLIITDQQSYDTLGAYGNNQIQTPNLDSLAEQSYIFDNAYVTQPVCTPSRASIYTGTYPHTNGVITLESPMFDEIQCLPEIINDNYNKAFIGKSGLHTIQSDGENEIHIQEPSKRLNTKEYFSVPPNIKPFNNKNLSKYDRKMLPEHLSGPAYAVEKSINFLKANKENKPFTLITSIYQPHDPWSGPLHDMYDPHSINLPKNFSDIPDENHPMKTRIVQKHLFYRGQESFPMRTELDWKNALARYWALCTLVDKQLGRLFDYLKTNNLWDNTIIVFTSDHGELLGSHKLTGKNLLFEESVKVPFLLKNVNQTTSKRIKTPVSLVDLTPTLLDLLDQPFNGGPVNNFEGQSLIPIMENEDINKRDVFIEWTGSNFVVSDVIFGHANPKDTNKQNTKVIPWYIAEFTKNPEASESLTDTTRTVITPDGWKLTLSLRGDHELYNLVDDPSETTNLIKQKRASDKIIKSLKEKIFAWQKRTNDKVTFGIS